MAVVNIVGFETGDTSECGATAGTFSVSATARSGAYALRTNPTGTAVGTAVVRDPSRTNWNLATAWFHFYFRVDTLPASGSEEIFTALNTAAGSKARIRIDSAGNLSVYNSGNVLVATGASVLSLSTFYKISFTCGTGAGSTAYELRLNDVTELSGSSTFNATNHGACRLGKFVNRNGNSVDYYYDDVVVDDAAFITGPLSVRILPVDSDGSSTTWSIGAGSGSDYQTIDDVPSNSDTDYLLSTGTPGDASLFGFASTASVPLAGSILGVKAFGLLKRNGASDGAVKLRVRSGGTNSDGASRTVTSAYTGFGHLLLVDPFDSAAWTAADLDAVEAGVVEDSANASRLSSFTLHVLYDPRQTISPDSLGGASLGTPTLGHVVAPDSLGGASLGTPTLSVGGSAVVISPPSIGGAVLGAITVVVSTSSVFAGSGTLTAQPRLVASATTTPAPSPVPATLYGPPLVRSPKSWPIANGPARWWANLIWFLRLFATGGRWLRRLPNNAGVSPSPLLAIEYGDVLADVTDPLVVFNSFGSSVFVNPRQLDGACGGVGFGAPVASPPVAPPGAPVPEPLPALLPSFTLASGASRRADVFVSGSFRQSTVLAFVQIDITDGFDDPTVTLILNGVRTPLIIDAEDWSPSNRPTLELVTKVDVFTSDYRLEQRTGVLRVSDGSYPSEFIHRIRCVYLEDLRNDRLSLYHRALRIKHRDCALPFLFEPLRFSTDLAGASSASPLNFALSSLLWTGYDGTCEVVRFDNRSPGVFESRIGTPNTGTNSVAFDRPFLLNIPAAAQTVYFVRLVRLVSIDRASPSDAVHRTTLVFESDDL